MGRFQPFHLGHGFAVQYALKQVDMLVIVVGSAQKSHEWRNPFSAGERLEMIKAALDEAAVDPKRWLAVPVPDADSHALWTATLNMLVPLYEVVFTNDELTTTLFREQGVRVDAVPLQRREALSATEVRHRLAEGGNWRELVLPGVASLLSRLGAEQRLRQLAELKDR